MVAFDSIAVKFLGLLGGFRAGGFVSDNFEEVRHLVDGKMVFEALINPIILAVMALFLLFAIYTKSKKIMMVIFAMYGYSGVYHYTLGGKSLVADNFETAGAADVKTLVFFFVGIMIITAIVLYVTFLKND